MNSQYVLLRHFNCVIQDYEFVYGNYLILIRKH